MGSGGKKIQQQVNRRIFLKAAGVSLALPFLESLDPFRKVNRLFGISDAEAQMGPLRKKFIGAFFPNGSFTPQGINGDWTWGDHKNRPGVLKELFAAHGSNLIAVRNMNSFGPDTHLYSVASFLSTHFIFRPGTASEVKQMLAPPSLDQRILKKLGTTGPNASIQIAQPIYEQGEDPKFPLPHVHYQNAISYGFNKNPLLGEFLPQNLFKNVFGGNPVNVAAPQPPSEIDYAHARSRSILDLVLAEKNAVIRKANREDALTITKIFDQVRDIEKALFGQNPTEPSQGRKCDSPATGNYQFSEDLYKRGWNSVDEYKAPFRLMQRIMVQAMDCDITSVGSIMYAPSLLGDNRFNFKGIQWNSHWASHGQPDEEDKRESLRAFNKMWIDLFQEMLADIKSRPGLMDKTIAVFGSDHGDPATHGEDNCPFLVAGAGSDLNLRPGGNEAISGDGFSFRGDVLRELGRLYGLPYQSFGENCERQRRTYRGLDPNGKFKNVGILRA